MHYVAYAEQSASEHTAVCGAKCTTWLGGQPDFTFIGAETTCVPCLQFLLREAKKRIVTIREAIIELPSISLDREERDMVKRRDVLLLFFK